HLRVDYSPVKHSPEKDGPNPAAEAKYRKQMERTNCGFDNVQILPLNIGYFKFNEFADPSIGGPTAIAAMNFLGHVDAIIFDLRENGGGDPKIRILTATMRSRRVSRARYTSPIPPAPIAERIS